MASDASAIDLDAAPTDLGALGRGGRRRHGAGTIGLVLAFGAFAACGAERPPVVLLVSLDTLRPDHLGAYGYERPTSPSIDRFRRDAVLFENAIATAPSTLPSHASMLTSLLTRQHGALFTRGSRLDGGAVTLAEILRSAGFATASFNGGGQLAPEWGLDRGFDRYESERSLLAGGDAYRDDVDRFGHTVARAIPWIDEHAAESFFLFLHSYEVHHPYTPTRGRLARFDSGYEGLLPPEISVELLVSVNSGARQIDDSDLGHIVAAYDAEISSADEAFGELIEHLQSQGLYDRALIIVTSDHGEEFAEHGVVGWHSHSLYDELLRVPLIVKLPGSKRAGETVTETVSMLDLAPTVLGVLGLAAPDSFLGRNLFPSCASVASPVAAVSEIDTAGSPVTAIRDADWKLYQEMLFDLESDAGERTDVAAEHAEIARRLAERRREALEARPAAAPDVVRLAPEAVERLRALGYLQ